MSEYLDRIKQHKFFYRDAYRRATFALWLVLLLIIILTFFTVYLYAQRRTPDFYATSTDGKVIKLTPLETPNYSKTPLIK